MRIKLDENIPARLVAILNALGHSTDTVLEEGLTGLPDHDVWRASQQTGRFLITQDLDFSDIRRFEPGTHCGIMLVRLPEPGREAITRRVEAVFKTEEVADWAGAFVVCSDRKIRIRRPREQAGERNDDA